MGEKDFRKKERRKLLIVATFCMLAIISIVGYTYSYFLVSDSDNTTITGTVASASLSIDVTKKVPSTNKGLVPQLDSAITSAVKGTKGNCIDDNGNEVCQVYEVTVTNTSNVAIKVDGTLRLNVGGNANLKWALIDSYTSGMTTKPNLVSAINAHQITTITANETYTAGAIKKYYIVIWISETGLNQTDAGTFNGVVTFKDSEPTTLASNTLYALGIAPNAEVPSFAKTSCSNGCGENTVGVYSMADDLGTSYYFRGDVENNYVKFANKYWRIIRINGDGTIRMKYDGTRAHANGESSTDRYVTSSYFNSLANDNTYVGYMYGIAGATTYNDTHSNKYDSDIKTYIEDTWYVNTIKSKEYEQYMADAIYCNDRILDTSYTSYTGIGKTETGYAAYRRLEKKTTPEPTLKCKNQNDRFTYNESVGGVLGNDKLEYPVGLLTIDEVVLAGGNQTTSNNKYFLYTGYYCWTMSPNYFNSSEGSVYRISASGYFGNNSVKTKREVCPVITISSNSLEYSATSNGTMEYPFTVTG